MYQDINQILATITAGLPTGRDDDPIRGLVASLDDPAELVYRSVREGLAGILYQRLKKAGALDLLGEELGRRLEQTYYHSIQNNLRLENELASVLKKMVAKDIPAVFLQGISLQNDLYPEPGLRPMYDIDVWVLPPDFAAFSKLLRNCGHTPDRLYPHTFRRGTIVFDIHTHLLWADRIEARRHLLAVRQEKIFRDAETFEVGGLPARRLNRYDQVLYLGMHALKHNVERLIWLVDIRLILAEFNSGEWAKLVSRADLLGQSRTLAQILFLLVDLLNFHIPDAVWRFRQANRLSGLEQWVLRGRKRKGVLPGWSTLVLFPAGMVRGRRHLIWETLFPKPGVLKQVFPNSVSQPVWTLYAQRLLQLASTPFKKKRSCIDCIN